MATLSGFPKATSRGCLNAVRSPNTVILSSRMCTEMRPNATSGKWSNVHSIFNCDLGKIVCFCQVTILSYAFEPLSSVLYDLEMPGECGIIWWLLVVPWKAAEGALAARVRALASRILKFLTSSPDSGVIWVITAWSACTASEVSSAADCVLALAR